ncbi:MAG: DUF1302 family protein [Campylobacterota bacterium]|nr:DUF1302 family protein [Campylobacterota bacterium]
MHKVQLSIVTASLLFTLFSHAQEVDLSGFDEEEEVSDHFENSTSVSSAREGDTIIDGLTGKLTQQLAYSYSGNRPHNNFTSFKSSLLLDYEHKFENGLRVKVNSRAYYDAIYKMKGRSDFSEDELNELESEVELFDAYIEGSLTDNFDIKLGRQVLVWGRSDTIRVTDVLNPLDNRRPGMVDIENLRLPVTMAKFDYFIEEWRITPVAILEQRFSKNPPFASAFYPLPVSAPDDEKYSDVSYALSVGGEFTRWDINLYAARIRDDNGHIVFTPRPKIVHEKVTMVGTAINLLSGSWLFKTEFAYFDGLKYTSVPNQTFKRRDLLLGFEYNGIIDTVISYDVVGRYIDDYDNRLLTELNPLHKQNYQHALRINSNFMNDTLTANYLLSLYGEKLDEGGFQRAWIEYELAEGVNTNIGVVDYIGGSLAFDAIKENDMVFADISYHF